MNFRVLSVGTPVGIAVYDFADRNAYSLSGRPWLSEGAFQQVVEDSELIAPVRRTTLRRDPPRGKRPTCRRSQKPRREAKARELRDAGWEGMSNMGGPGTCGCYRSRG